MKEVSNLFLAIMSLSIMGSAVIMIVLLLDRIFRINYSRQWLYIIWAVIAIRLIIPVNINIIDLTGVTNSNGAAMANIVDSGDSIKTKDASDPIEISNNIAGEHNQLTENTVDASGNTSDVIAKNESFKNNSITNKLSFFLAALDIIAVIWLAGLILFLLYHIGAYLSYRKKISRWNNPVDNNEVLEQYLDLCKELKIKRQINIITCKQVQSPMLIGFFKPCIALPIQEYTAEQYYFILKHELIHYKHRDLFYKLILLLATAFHWFNPLIHYMVYLANHDMELYCDEKVIAKNDLHYREKYSKMLLQSIAAATKNNNLLLSTGFSSQNSRLKNRFFQIMNLKPTKKGRGLILLLVCLMIVGGNIIAWLIPSQASNAEIAADQQIDLPASFTENKDTDPIDLLEEVSNILVVGLDSAGSEEHLRADSILLVSVNPDTKKISLISFLRDMYLQVPEHGKEKLVSVYQLGGSNLIKDTIEANFDIRIDHTVSVNMQAFENIINSVGGAEVVLSEEEAKYLNSTNYISKQQYRNVIAGKQILNGNQALGYIRVRQVPTIQGENGDFGRTARLRTMISYVIDECRKKDVLELTEVMMKVLLGVSTDLSISQALIYINTLLQGELATDTRSIPVFDTYTAKVQDGRSVLDVDLDKNIEILKQINP
jgi:LCP family protein required for cell wall assembly